MDDESQDRERADPQQVAESRTVGRDNTSNLLLSAVVGKEGIKGKGAKENRKKGCSKLQRRKL